jgi:predicted AlkP superfamily pyrophosphatase or phosphodiesterase
MQKLARLLTTVFLCLFALCASGAENTPHVVVVVWDGMRPDFVSEGNTPNLATLARQGVTFTRHHPVYISSTEVNGTALATGVYPEQSGIIGNKEFRPGLDPTNRVLTGDFEVVQRGDKLSHEHFLGAATVAEILHTKGLRTAIAGAKTVTILHDRHADLDPDLAADVFEGHVLPASLAKPFETLLGKFPPVTVPKRGRDLWTTQALIGPLWEKGLPSFSVLWLSEPDYSQHESGPGSPTALEAIRSSDENLGRVLAALEHRGWRDQTDVLVVSDHAFSTIDHTIDLVKILNSAGFHAVRDFRAGVGQSGDVMVVGNGGTAFLYVLGREQSVIEKLVHYVQGEPFCGVVFTRQPVEGAFRLTDAHINSPDAPDIALSLRWTAEPNQHGVPGKLYSDYSEYGPGQGMHASLSAYDMHNICFAAGPHFRKGYRDELPSGNIDVAPTVLAILGVKPPKPMSGRVLTEALPGSEGAAPSAQSRHLETSYRAPHFIWHQYLDEEVVNGVVYFDGGNGHQEPLKDIGGN